jgi:hypothetical protein
VYELLANERIAQYQREAAQDRQLRSGVVEAHPIKAPAAVTPGGRSSRRALGASFLGVAAMAILRRRS